MDVYEAARQRTLNTLLRVNEDFQRVFGKDVFQYADASSGLICIDFPRLFNEIGFVIDTPTPEDMRRKYGSEAVDLIGELIS